MRLFVAVFPPARVQDILYNAARDLAPENTIRAVEASNIHLTLKFLGEVPATRLIEIKESLSTLRERHAPFEAWIAGFGAFPSRRKARVLWTGIGSGAGNFRSLAEDLESLLEPLGFEREPRAFRPHLTLGRARGHALSLDLECEGPTELSFRTREISLVKSRLERGGPVYETLAAWPLGPGVTRRPADQQPSG